MSDEILERARNNSRRHLKRKYDTRVACIKCKSPHIVSNHTYAYICSKCGKCNVVAEAQERFEKGEWEEPESKHSRAIEMPAFRTSDEGRREYANLRDEHEIRAEFYQNGITRDNVGVNKFNSTLKKELKANKCYRGDRSGV